MKNNKTSLKTFMVSALVLSLATFSQAQIFPAGTMMLGGDISFTSTSYDDVDDAVTQFSFAPSFGYFVIDNLGIGLMLNVTTVKDSYSIFGVGPYVRYYVWQGLFPQVNLLYSSFKPDGGDSGILHTFGRQ
ncbi:MAG: hypothetical protein K9I85_05975 [Saprospiraceae bacterium]|nr:hypothetical protein [Saprospiraceae bacterium]